MGCAPCLGGGRDGLDAPRPEDLLVVALKRRRPGAVVDVEQRQVLAAQAHVRLRTQRFAGVACQPQYRCRLEKNATQMTRMQPRRQRYCGSLR